MNAASGAACSEVEGARGAPERRERSQRPQPLVAQVRHCLSRFLREATVEVRPWLRCRGACEHTLALPTGTRGAACDDRTPASITERTSGQLPRSSGMSGSVIER